MADPFESDLDGEVFAFQPRRDETNERLDKFVAARMADLGLSRTMIQGLIESGRVLVDGVPRRAKFKMTPGETVEITLPPPEIEAIEPEPIPLAIVYEDDDLIVLDKPAGLVVHPAPGHPTGTLVNALLHHAPDINVGGSNRPGIVHRLDKDTSGLMVIAKSDRARTSLVAQWASREVRKGYLALVVGLVEPDEGTIDAPIGRDPSNRQRMAVGHKGRSAITHFTVRRRFARQTLLDLDLETGRTHQLRVHLAFIGHPIVGDPVYGRRTGDEPVLDRQFLHAARLAFRLPTGEPVAFESPLPTDLRAVLDALDDASAG
jgi:23S rRNA pseudouridine1911/1915/1917 synthase